MNKFIVTLFFVITAQFPVSASGQSTTIVCNDCSVSAKIKAAKSLSNKNISNVVIVDFKNKSANKYRVSHKVDAYGDPLVSAVVEQLDSEELSDLQALYAYRAELIEVIKEAENKSRNAYPQCHSKIASSKYRAEDNTATASNNSPTSDHYFYAGSVAVMGSPYDFMTSSFIRNDIYDYYFSKRTSGLTAILSNTFKTIQFPSMNEMGIYLDVQFYDDTKGNSANGFLSISINTVTKSIDVLGGRDGFNNSIPLNIAAARGNFVFGNGTGEKTKFESYLSTLTGEGSGTGEGGGGCSVIKAEMIGNRTIFTYQC